MITKPNMCGKAVTYIPDTDCSECMLELQKLRREFETFVEETNEALSKKIEATDIQAGKDIIVDINGNTVTITNDMSAQDILELFGFYEMTISKDNDDGTKQIAHLIGYIETEENPIVFSGLDPLTVEVGEEFDPLEGVSAIGCNDEPATVTVEE